MYRCPFSYENKDNPEEEPVCDHDRYYNSEKELIEHHWMKSCHYFSHVYQLCRYCDKRVGENIGHDGKDVSQCIANLSLEIDNRSHEIAIIEKNKEKE